MEHANLISGYGSQWESSHRSVAVNSDSTAMPRISSRILKNRVDIYSGTPADDDVGAPQFTYPCIPTYRNVPCSVQFRGVEEVVNEQGRITQRNHYDLIFADPPCVRPRDMILWVDATRRVRTLFAQATTDEAGRGYAFTVKAIERQ